jgi:hypothetical protein
MRQQQNKFNNQQQ